MIRLKYYRNCLFLLTWWKETLIFTDYGNELRSSEPICMFTLSIKDWEEIKKICSPRFKTSEILGGLHSKSKLQSKDFIENLNHLYSRGKITLPTINEFTEMVEMLEKKGFKVLRYLGNYKYIA